MNQTDRETIGRHRPPVLNPDTGALEDSYFLDDYTIRPPAVDFFVHNVGLGPDFFRGFRASLEGTLEDILAGIGEHVKNGEYGVMSLSASRYSVVLILKSKRKHDDLDTVFFELQGSLVEKAVQRSREKAQVISTTESS